LTRLAVSPSMDTVWNDVVRLLRKAPNSADRVVAASPGNPLRADMQETILSAADTDNICAAIAFARGVRTHPPRIMDTTACAFFATVTPEVWTALPAETQRAWRDDVPEEDSSLTYTT